jgi:leucyl-tRNA synthetase
MPLDISEDDAKAIVLAIEEVLKYLDGKEVRKFIFVKGKIVNIVS